MIKMEGICDKIWELYDKWLLDDDVVVAGDGHIDQIEQFLKHLTKELKKCKCGAELDGKGNCPFDSQLLDSL